MKIKKMAAERVFGSLNFSFSFNDQLTFLTGINGSGKTTAIRLLLAITTPSLRQLDEIPHERAQVNLQVGQDEITIISSVRENEIVLEVNRVPERLIYPRLDPRQYEERPSASERIEEHYSIIEEKYSSHPVIQYLTSIDTPVFLGIERKQQSLFGPSRIAQDRYIPNRDRWRRRAAFRGILGASLQEVLALSQDIFRRIRITQDKLNQKLREDILLSAFEYAPFQGELALDAVEAPTWKDHQFIGQKQKEIYEALMNLGISPERFKPKIENFFDRLSKLASAWKKNTDSPEFLEWIVNKPQIDRITSIFRIVEDYSAKVHKLMAPVDRYLSLVNRFLDDSGKKLDIDPVGLLFVKLRTGRSETIAALSSGERQIVVMLGHLALNEAANRAGIFIVDEPELSLHLRWQEKFVESILEASPSTQFILATHSPAIVLDRQDSCITLSA